MADSYPYILTPDALAQFIDGIPGRSVPAKVGQQYLESIGLKSTNHRKIVSILRFLGLIGSKGAPTDKFSALRNREQTGAALAQAIREAYHNLFSLYPDAYRKDAEALRNFFAAQTNVGERALEAMVATFRTLAGKADFDAQTPALEKPSTPKHVTKKVVSTVPRCPIAINIQLHIPATSEADVYENLFKALRKYVLDLSTEA